MVRFVFHSILAGLAALSFFASALAAETRIAIIDTAYDTRPYLDKLKERGVAVIGRYYARCDQPEYGLTQKRLINQGLPNDPSSEVAQLFAKGFAILSIYQYYSNTPNKFHGQNRDGEALPDANCQWTGFARTVEEEARLDVDAAISQARSVGQPPGTAIYFGVDFNFQDSDRETIDLMQRYFRVIRRSMVASGYKLGAYGSGRALEILQQTDGGLIDYAWISASRAFTGTSEFHRSGNWHLFQNQVDREWFGTPRSGGGCTHGLPLDTNVQNMFQSTDVGFWQGNTSFVVPEERTFDIFATRRFACDGDAVIRREKSSSASDVLRAKQCKGGKSLRVPPKIDYANAARIGDVTDTLAEVDVDDDGTFDGWTRHNNLTGHFGWKPDWIFDTSRRNSQSCG
ncbi:glycoside hydrolase domain-containing protein [Marivita hallyeonensis]|uniref:Rv2525c-like glycoside hydrolase-like domain-containing protein n=1 Tax=Marivita hallyeonensis TaxID=996342 RepID=A0A1M5NSH8_9RHOB|nr:glycoside hydrolase domain-containing protein [Marivita hallyeonensis]SHG92492.1 protein of unknown function [Marivita hallyeonensis]